MEIEYSTGNSIGAFNDARVITHKKLMEKRLFNSSLI